jgi:U3 small nucleolar RNA-associated protein 3
MGRKRKAGGRPYGGTEPEEFQSSSKLKLNSYEDIADSEDEFAAGRDKILLEEGPEAKRRRKLREEGMYCCR